MKLKMFISGLLCFFLLKGHTQLTIRPELMSAIENNNSFTDVMKTVTEYYVQNGYLTNPELFREFKKWNRWAWYEMRHLDQDGKFVGVNQKTNTVLEIERQELEKEAGTDRTNGGYWTPVGPYNIASGIGRVDRLAFHPTDANRIYAGTPAGGLWQTFNGGDYWFPMNGFTPGLGVSGIIVDADNPNLISVLSGDGDSFINSGFIYTRNSVGLLQSTDGGVHWSIISNIVPEGTTFFGFKLLQSSTLHYLYFACTNDGLYRSNDYGRTWTRNASIGVATIFDIEQADNGYIYVATERSVFISSDFGTTFTAVPSSDYATPPTNSTTRTSIAVPANAQTTLYVHFGGDGLIYQSTDNGSSFTRMSNSAPTASAYMSAMTVSPANANNVILGSLQITTSTNGGQVFPNTGMNIHADVHDLEYNPLSGILFAGCDGGVYKSFDNGLNWQAAYNGMNATQYYHMSCYATDNTIFMAGAQDNGQHASNGFNAFTQAFGGDGFDAAFYNGNRDTAYFSLNAGVYKYAMGTGNTQLLLSPGTSINDQNFFFPHLAVHPTNNSIVYAGFITSVYRSIDGGKNWITIGNSASAGFGAAGGLAVSPNVPDRLYAANGTSAWRFDNQGANWTLISGTPGWPAGSPVITDIETRPNNANEVVVTFGGYGGTKMIYSSTGGASWGDLTGSLPDVPVYCAEFLSDGDVYIGTDAGVYFKDYAWSDWVRFSNGLPVLPVTELVVDEVNADIRAATFGRGIWVSDMYSDCGPFLLLSGTTVGTNFHQSNGFIETTQVQPGSYGNVLLLRSPTKIIFKNGFRAFQNSDIRAVIGNCGQGILEVTDTPDPAMKSVGIKPIIELDKRN